MIVAGAAAAISASTALFVVDVRAPRGSNERQDASERATAQSTLSLPDPNDPARNDPRRRSKLGMGESHDASEDDAARNERDAAALAGLTIALVPASAPPMQTAQARSIHKVGTLRIPCAAPGPVAALATERALLDALETKLTDAGAHVVRLDDASGAVPCAQARISAQERADAALVVDAADAAATITPARAVGALRAEDQITLRMLTDSLARQTKIRAHSATDAAVAQRLARGGIVDLADGGATVRIALGRTFDPAGSERLVDDVASAIASWAAARPSASAATRASAPTTPRPRASASTQPTPSAPPATRSPAPDRAPAEGALGSSGPGSDD